MGQSREGTNIPAVSAAWCWIAARSLMKAFSAAALASEVEVYARWAALRGRRDVGWFARSGARRSIARAAAGIIVAVVGEWRWVLCYEVRGEDVSLRGYWVEGI